MSENGVSTAPEKLAAVKEWPTPRNSFLRHGFILQEVLQVVLRYSEAVT